MNPTTQIEEAIVRAHDRIADAQSENARKAAKANWREVGFWLLLAIGAPIAAIAAIVLLAPIVLGR
jgi:anti-sigma-K factor RskA